MRPTSRSRRTRPSSSRTSRRGRAAACRRARSARGAAGRRRGAHRPSTCARRCRAGEGDGQRRLGHAVAGHEGLAVSPTGRSSRRRRRARRGGSCRRRCRHAPAREVELGRHRPSARRVAQVVAEARAVGDGAAVVRDQVQPQQRPAHEGARRQVVDRDLAESGATGSRPGPCRDRAAARSRRGRPRVEPGGPVMPALAISAAWVNSTPWDGGCCPRRTGRSRGRMAPADAGRLAFPAAPRLLDMPPCRRTAGS